MASPLILGVLAAALLATAAADPELCGGMFERSSLSVTAPQGATEFRCKYVFRSTYSGKVARIVLNGEDLDSTTIEIYDFTRDGVKLLASGLASSIGEGELISEGNTVLVEFASTGSANGSSFGFDITSISVPCNRKYSDSEGSVSSPNYPDNYPNYSDCEYEIQVEGAAGIEINLESFNLESSGSCGYDSLTIYSYIDGERHQEKKMCGQMPLFENNIIAGSKVLLRFKTDGSATFSGFSLTYRAVDEVPREMSMRCEAGWTRFKNDCHKYFSSKAYYPEAASNCRAENAHVLIPRSQEENGYYRMQMIRWNSEMWLGVSDVITEGVWTDDGGSSISWANWDEPEPNNRWGSEDCVQMKNYGQWNDISCTTRQFPYFCVKSIDNNTDSTLPSLPFPEDKSDECEDGWRHEPIADRCIRFFTNDMIYTSAQRTCRDAGAVVLLPQSEAENNFYTQAYVVAYGERRIWLGLDDREREGRMVADGGQSKGYSNWDDGEPNDKYGEDCVELRESGGWNDLPCHSRYPFICTKPRPGNESTTEAPAPELELALEGDEGNTITLNHTEVVETGEGVYHELPEMDLDLPVLDLPELDIMSSPLLRLLNQTVSEMRAESSEAAEVFEVPLNEP